MTVLDRVYEYLGGLKHLEDVYSFVPNEEIMMHTPGWDETPESFFMGFTILGCIEGELLYLVYGDNKREMYILGNHKTVHVNHNIRNGEVNEAAMLTLVKAVLG